MTRDMTREMTRTAGAVRADRQAGRPGADDPLESLASLAAQVRELRAALDRQQEMLARQEQLLRQERAARARQDEIITELRMAVYQGRWKADPLTVLPPSTPDQTRGAAAERPTSARHAAHTLP